MVLSSWAGIRKFYSLSPVCSQTKHVPSLKVKYLSQQKSDREEGFPVLGLSSLEEQISLLGHEPVVRKLRCLCMLREPAVPHKSGNSLNPGFQVSHPFLKLHGFEGLHRNILIGKKSQDTRQTTHGLKPMLLHKDLWATESRFSTMTFKAWTELTCCVLAFTVKPPALKA